MKLVGMRTFGLVCLLTASTTAIAGPWWTGPLLAPAGHNIPAGHTNVELYGFHTDNDGIYNRHWKLTHTAGTISDVFNPLFTHGLSDKLDLQIGVPYAFNKSVRGSSHHISDTGVTLGYQLIEQKEARFRPDVRFTLQEIIPTGRFLDLNPVNNGAGSTGLGSYQTAASLNFQLLTPFTDVHYLRTRLSVSYVYASDVNLHGFSSYGGSDTTYGIIDPGNLASLDIAGEFSLTQHWVAVMEGYFAKRDSAIFRGNPGITATGLPAAIGNDTVEEFTIAPALEYNFNANVGIIGGVWFTLAGKDTSEFQSIVIALNAYF